MKYSKPTKNNGRLESVEIYEGESIETKCARVLESGEPITDTAPIIYTAKEDGVLPAYNIRTDRFDIAMDAYDKMTRNSAKKEITSLNTAVSEVLVVLVLGRCITQM